MHTAMNTVQTCVRAALLGMLCLLPLGCADGQRGDLLDPLSFLPENIIPPTPTQAVQWATNPYDADQRRRGLSLLCAAPFGGEEPYVKLYRAAASDEDTTVRAVAIMALGYHGSPEDATVLIRHLKHANTQVRWEAAKALQKLHNEAAILPLIEAMRDDDSDVRQAAAYALGQYRQLVVVDALINTLDDNDFGVIDAALNSLITLTGYNMGLAAGDWVEWKNRRDHTEVFEYAKPYTWQPYNRPAQWYTRIVPPFTAPEPKPARTPSGLDPYDIAAGS